jgi:hypothetical protein
MRTPARALGRRRRGSLDVRKQRPPRGNPRRGSTADAAANRVVVAGTADAAALKARLEAKTKKAVEIISAGSGPKRPAPAAEPKDAGAGEKKTDKDASPKEEKEKIEEEGASTRTLACSASGGVAESTQIPARTLGRRRGG